MNDLCVDVYLFDGALLQMFLHRLLDEELLLVELHPWVFLHDVLHDRLVGHPRAIVAGLRRHTTVK